MPNLLAIVAWINLGWAAILIGLAVIALGLGDAPASCVAVLYAAIHAGAYQGFVWMSRHWRAR